MAPQEPPSEVTVRVKVPPGHIVGTNEDEFTLGILSTSLPVTALRQRITTLIPTNPPANAQRILYGGRALIDDAQSLADALNTRRDPTQTEYVVHLLIRPGGRVENMNQILGMTPLAQTRQDGASQNVVDTRPGQPGIQTTTNTMPPPMQPQHVHPHGQGQPPRPVSSSGFHIQGTGPDGRAFTIHQQFTTNGMPMQPGMHPAPGVVPQLQFPGIPAGLPHMPFPGLPAGFPHMPQPTPGLPHMQMPGPMAVHPNLPLPIPIPNIANLPQNTQQQPVLSALERARENMTEMRRMLEQLRNETTTSDTTRAQVTELEQRMQAVNDYIDPFHVGTRGRSRSASPARTTRAGATPIVPPQPAQPAMSLPIPGLPPQFNMPMMPLQPMRMPQMPPHIPQFQHPMPQMQPLSSDRTSVYLLSSPQGPHALLFSPQHGTYTGHAFAPQQNVPASPSTSMPVPTPTQPNAQAGNEQANAVQLIPNAAADPANIAQLQAQADPLAFFQPILGHLWLLLRILIFAYIVMGSNMGWRRPIALALIGFGFWLIRLGLFGNGGLVRRWWDGVVHIDRAAQPQAPNNAAPQQAPGQNADPQVRPEGQAAGDAGRLPTPEEYAQRLIREQRERTPLHRLREQVRPAERALALFLASLWPGVGERYVQALDRAREEEEAARRAIEAQREEAARLAREASEQAEKKEEVAESSVQGEKQELAGATESAGPDQQAAAESAAS